jgi:hypothetical protein
VPLKEGASTLNKKGDLRPYGELSGRGGACQMVLPTRPKGGRLTGRPRSASQNENRCQN